MLRPGRVRRSAVQFRRAGSNGGVAPANRNLPRVLAPSLRRRTTPRNRAHLSHLVTRFGP